MRPSLGFRRTKNAFRELKPNKAILGYSEHKETFCFVCVWGGRETRQVVSMGIREYPKVLSLSRDIFERHAMNHPKERVFNFKMMLIYSRCTVSFNNYCTLYMVHSILLACFRVIEL